MSGRLDQDWRDRDRLNRPAWGDKESWLGQFDRREPNQKEGDTTGGTSTSIFFFTGLGVASTITGVVLLIVAGVEFDPDHVYCPDYDPSLPPPPSCRTATGLFDEKYHRFAEAVAGLVLTIVGVLCLVGVGPWWVLADRAATNIKYANALERECGNARRGTPNYDRCRNEVDPKVAELRREAAEIRNKINRFDKQGTGAFAPLDGEDATRPMLPGVMLKP